MAFRNTAKDTTTMVVGGGSVDWVIAKLTQWRVMLTSMVITTTVLVKPIFGHNYCWKRNSNSDKPFTQPRLVMLI